MKLVARLAMLMGAMAVVALVLSNGAAEIGGAIMAAGWGILLVIALHVPQLIFSCLAWRAVLPHDEPPGAALFFVWRMVREAVNALLPVPQVAGEIVVARLMALRGVPLGIGTASLTIDLTMEVFGQVIFTLIGLGLLLLDQKDPQIAGWIESSLLSLLAMLVAFVLAQRFGLLRLIENVLLRLGKKWRWKGIAGLAGLHDAAVAVYRSPLRVFLGATHHVISWLLGTFEVMAALYALDVPVTLHDALIIESLTQVFRSLGFAVPGALGVQEGGLILVCGLFGLGPQTAIELSMLKRVREVALGLPGLLVWWWEERRGRAGTVEVAGEPLSKETA